MNVNDNSRAGKKTWQGKAKNHHHHYHATTNRQTENFICLSFLIERLLQSNLSLYAYNSLHLVCIMENYYRQCRYRLSLMCIRMLLLALDRENINLVDKIIYHFFLLLILFCSLIYLSYMTNQPAF